MATQLQVRPPQDAMELLTRESSAPIIVGASLVGQTVGSYQVIKELGKGGMGCVYLAEHSLIGRKAAVKVLNPDIASDPEVVSRFFTEARAVNDIRHPNIVEVTDFGKFGPFYCIVMEYLEGETLAGRLSRVRVFDEPSVIRIMKQCTSALGAAHEQGLVHRDIKPENIFLRAHPDYPDFVKLLDFGIAKLLTADTNVGHHTKTGSVLGTPSYMSPEQCLGEAALDIRSDVYSLGVVIYQMLTGQLPFMADTLGRLIVCHVNEPPVPPSVINPGISRAMNDLVIRTLQKRPKDRFQSARDMRDALDRLLPPQPRSLTPAAGIPMGGGTKFPTRLETPGRREAVPMPTPVTMIAHGPRPAAQLTPASAQAIPVATPSGDDFTQRLTSIVRDRIRAETVELPDLSAATIRCLDLDRRGRLGFSDAAQVIAEVPPLRSRVMRLANSAAFPSLMPATTLELAVGRLGAQGLLSALMEFAAREALEGRHPRVKELMRRIWPHALGVAVMAADLCSTVIGDGEKAGRAYVTGLMYQIGRPVVAGLLVDIEAQMQRAGKRPVTSDAVWLGTMDACHPSAGAAVARHWELPQLVVDAIEEVVTWNSREPLCLSNVVRFSAILVNRLGLSFGQRINGPELERMLGEGRALLRIGDATIARVSHGFKERIVVLSGIRG
ncbi:MAG TPA: protein kinase [Polyangia bacterium]|jgi:serine/threonine protein kinase/HD-like signal output (HDOD) protein